MLKNGYTQQKQGFTALTVNQRNAIGRCNATIRRLQNDLAHEGSYKIRLHLNSLISLQYAAIIDITHGTIGGKKAA